MIFKGESSYLCSIYRLVQLMMLRTGSVILAGFINAAERACAASGKDPRDHRVVFLGGGSAAVG